MLAKIDVGIIEFRTSLTISQESDSWTVFTSRGNKSGGYGCLHVRDEAGKVEKMFVGSGIDHSLSGIPIVVLGNNALIPDHSGQLSVRRKWLVNVRPSTRNGVGVGVGVRVRVVSNKTHYIRHARQQFSF